MALRGLLAVPCLLDPGCVRVRVCLSEPDGGHGGRARSPISKVRKMGTPKASPSPARRMAAEKLRAELTPQKCPSASATPSSASSSAAKSSATKNYKEAEPLTVRLNVYDLVWNRNDSNDGPAKNAASGFENLGFGLYHSALEIWGKEISFGHSKRYKSGVFAVKPRRAQEYMPNTRFKTSIEMSSLMFSRHRCACRPCCCASAGSTLSPKTSTH